jgi:hypothetical protein
MIVYLRVRGEVDDRVARREVELDVLHRQVLQQVRKLLRPPSAAGGVFPAGRRGLRRRRFQPTVGTLVDAEDIVAVAKQTEREVRADLPGRAGDQDPHRAGR